MDLNKIIRELLEEREKLDRIVASLEQLQRASEAPRAQSELRRGRKSMDPGARQEVSLRMKRYWANRKKEETTS